VRYFIEGDFGEIASRYLSHIACMRIDPPPKDQLPSIWRLLIETAVQRKSENIPPNLAGEWLRAILTGAPYPLTLLSTLLMRLRADHDVNVLRAGLIKAVLIRNFAMEVPVALDPENSDPGYLLGRLFAVLEKTQALAQGNVNASIKDRYYGAASATPRTVFPLLLRLNAHHQNKAVIDGSRRSSMSSRSSSPRLWCVGIGRAFVVIGIGNHAAGADRSFRKSCARSSGK
jgi:CRISPR-associated protein Csd1